MPKPFDFLLMDDEQGQMFVGYLIAILLVTVSMVNVMRLVRSQREQADRRVYQSMAVSLARQGFEDGLSYFRRKPGGVYLDDDGAKPLSQNWVSPWPIYPDSAFAPGINDTDHWNLISFSANANPFAPHGTLVSQQVGARAIIRNYPMSATSPLTTSGEVRVPPLWGRYVIRRQNYRNWSPGPNTFSAFTDPEAAHDLTHQRNNGIIGSGNYWSLVARSYIIANPGGVSLTSGFEVPAMYDGNNLVSAPKRYYNNKRFLLATARVYGELYRINFEDRAAAAWVNTSASLTINGNGIVNGASQGRGVVCSGAGVPSAGGGFLGGGLGAYQNNDQPPTVSRVFPGLSKTKLRALADIKGGMSVFPTADQPNLTDIASRSTFYYITGATSTFLSGTAERVMTGVGVVFVDGNLVFNAGNLSAWSGIIFVDGNCSVRGPVEISGSLIVTGTLTVGNAADNNKANIEYNAEAVEGVKAYLQRFRVDKNSVLAIFN